MPKLAPPHILLVFLGFPILSCWVRALPDAPPAACIGLPSVVERRPSAVPAPQRIEVEPSGGPVPWTHLNVPNGADTFHFVVVADRTGSMRRGVFESAVSKINLLGPELVLSVGDLIPGYSKDPRKVRLQWDEFDRIVGGLQAPFFYVPGNHDVTNPVTESIWRERRGPLYYSFEYRGVLFICLDSRDGASYQVGSAQMAWLERTLVAHASVKWTFLFMHMPLWDSPHRPTTSAKPGDAWRRIATALLGRKFTAFAGHHHRYVKHERDGSGLFTLATTGGGNSLRGSVLGEFEHFVWVTMTPEGPVVANLLLDGIWDENVRTEAERRWQNEFPRDEHVQAEPLYYTDRFEGAAAVVRLHNDRDVALRFTLEVNEVSELSVTPEVLTVEVAPGEVVEEALHISAPVALEEELLVVPFDWRAEGEDSSGKALSLKGASRVVATRVLDSLRDESPVRVDGELGEWGALPIVVDKPRYVSNSPTAWKSPVDGRFSIGVRHDAEALYVAVHVQDDSVSAGVGTPPWKQDGVEIRIDARPPSVRSSGRGVRDGKDSLLLALSPNRAASSGGSRPVSSIDLLWPARGASIVIPDGVKVACVRSSEGFDAEVAIPRRWLIEVGGMSAETVRVNVAVDDRDADGQSQLWWWPDWRSDRDVPGSGTFRIRD